MPFLLSFLFDPVPTWWRNGKSKGQCFHLSTVKEQGKRPQLLTASFTSFFFVSILTWGKWFWKITRPQVSKKWGDSELLPSDHEFRHLCRVLPLRLVLNGHWCHNGPRLFTHPEPLGKMVLGLQTHSLCSENSADERVLKLHLNLLSF